MRTWLGLSLREWLGITCGVAIIIALLIPIEMRKLAYAEEMRRIEAWQNGYNIYTGVVLNVNELERDLGFYSITVQLTSAPTYSDWGPFDILAGEKVTKGDKVLIFRHFLSSEGERLGLAPNGCVWLAYPIKEKGVSFDPADNYPHIILNGQKYYLRSKQDSKW